MQVDPVKPNLKPPGTKRLKLNCDELRSTSAFKFNMRRFMMKDDAEDAAPSYSAAMTPFAALVGRGLHSSTFRLNVSAFSGTGDAFTGCVGGV